jgi:hypothetical protein
VPLEAATPLTAQLEDLPVREESLKRERAWWIQEGTDGAESLKPEDAAYIERIAIKKTR